jgi:hypothetical protein
MIKRAIIVILSCTLLLGADACKSKKIPCPTYKDSFPDKPSKKRKTNKPPKQEKPSKPKSGVLPPGYKGK